MKVLRGIAAGLFAAALVLPSVPTAADDQPELPTLVSPAQLERERLALRIMATPEMRAAIQHAEDAYAADPAARIPAGKATLEGSVRAIALAAVYYAIGLARDPGDPQLFWCCKAAQRLGGVLVPGSGYGIDNPDNVYRITHLDGASHYVVRGRLAADRPAQLHIEVRDAIPGTTAMNAEGGMQVATLSDDALVLDEQGRFAITIDSSPANGRPGHLQLPVQGTFHVVVRDLLTDWQAQRPVTLTIERLEGPELSRTSEAVIAQSAAGLLGRIAPFWLDYDNRFIFSRPANTLSPARQRPGGRGFSAAGHFALGAGEALVLTLDPLGAQSLGVQLADPWGVAYDYIGRSSSLNLDQAKPNPDGTVTMMIAARDPGFVNWLDPSGHGEGIIALRWQGLPAGAEPGSAIRRVETVPVTELRRYLSGPEYWLAPEQRRAQLAARAQDHERRKRASED